MNTTRRGFLKYSASGIAITIAPIGVAKAALMEERFYQPPEAQEVGKLKRRVEGVAKVCGDKVFARDIRARDMEGWPDKQAHAFMILANRADAPFEGLDLSLLGGDLQPDSVVTAVETQKAGLDFSDPFTYGTWMFLPEGELPIFLGHPLAILIYNDFARFAVAKRIYKKKRAEIVRFGDATDLIGRDPYANYRFVRVEGEGGATGSEDVYNSVDDMYVPAEYIDNQARWPAGAEAGTTGARGMFHANAIRAELDSPPESWHVIEREYHSPYIDAAALEPDNCNCWFDESAGKLEIVMASQSPHEVMTGAAEMLDKSTFDVSDLRGHPAYTVGYGTKEHSPFPYYCVVAALYSGGRPVRLALDREEHFQTSIKRHPIKMKYRLAVDRKSLKFTSFSGDLETNGGGRANYTPAVTQVAAGAAQGIYYLPKNDIVGIGISSRAPHCGSVRAFGSLEAQIGTEMLIEELAQELDVDSMDLRLKNALVTGERNAAGAVPLGASRMKEMIEGDRQHPVWLNRKAHKEEFEAANPALKYGVGYAISKKGFGNSNEGVAASISLSPDGQVKLRHIAVEIGTGAISTQALMCARWFGKAADEIESAALDWKPLDMFVTLNPFVVDREHQAKMKEDPRWTPAFASASSATNSAFYFTHATNEAGRLIHEYGILPAVAALWSAPDDLAKDARWKDGVFALPDGRSLTIKEIAAKVHQMGGVTGAMVHGFDRWGWAEADFDILGKTTRRPLDGVAIQTGSDEWTRLERRNVFYMDPQADNSSWSRFAVASALIEVSVNRGTGEIKILSHHSSMDCGRILVPEFVSGQLQGGIAMSIGHALFEKLPLYEGGPGQGGWNFNRYRLPRGKDVAVWKQTANFLPVTEEENFPKGIAEVVQNPTVPAVANAVADAVGHWIREMPITPDKIIEVLS